MSMYLKDKTEHFTIRLSKEQMEHLELLSEMTQISKADLIRGYIDKSMGVKWLNDNKQRNSNNKL